VNFQGLYLFRTLSDIGELQPKMLIALDVPDGFEDGQQVVIAQSDWRLRPGQLVPVLLSESPPAPGLYIPMTAILKSDENSGVVFVAKEGLARRVEIRILEHAGELIQIVPVDESSTLLQPGSDIILDYIHFLQDREPVSVIQRRELKL
jgi:multidrug efflux pump subunit AcrA (membrane-fusion protein)